MKDMPRFLCQAGLALLAVLATIFVVTDSTDIAILLSVPANCFLGAIAIELVYNRPKS